MNLKTLALAAALSGSFALAQQPPSPPPSGGPAPIERQPPQGRGPVTRGPRPARGPVDHGTPSTGQMRGGDGHGMWWKDPNVAQQLSLSADQLKRIDTIFEQSRLQLIDLRASLQKQEVLLDPMLSANPVDTAKASAQIDKVAQARAELEKANAKMLLGIRGVLSADQWTKLNDRRGMRRGFGQQGPQSGPQTAPAPPAGGPNRGPGGGPVGARRVPGQGTPLQSSL